MASNPVALGVVALMRQSEHRPPQHRRRSRRWLRRRSAAQVAPTTAPSRTRQPEVGLVHSSPPSAPPKPARVTPAATPDPAR